MQLTIRGAVRYATMPALAVVLATSALASCSSSSSTPPITTSSTPASDAAHHDKPARPTCPLTGAPRTKHEFVKRVPLAVKIDNVSDALPQSGINHADVVIEELVEGGLTRLMAVFQCDSAKTVGPIRSLRISDADILALLHGSVLGYSGANPADLPPVVARSQAVLISQDANPQYFYRSTAHVAPHNVYSSTKRVLRAGIARKKSLNAPKPLFSYGAIDPAAKRAHNVSMSWPAASAAWKWSKHGWLRTQNGSLDKLSDGSTVSSTNVVIMSVDIASTGLHDVLGTPSPQDVTVGNNRVWVLRDGKMIQGTWHRKSVASNLTFTDKKGNAIRLAPGRTWVELLPTGRKPLRH
jgi:hypothetical protein